MKCPFCDVEMLYGYLNCASALWSEKKHKLGLLPNGKEKYALNLRHTMMSVLHNVESFCCPKCKKVIIDTADYENNLD